ncbi:TPA: hypothetical protein KNT26_002966 [Clostridioides difficile]|nr:hypothetical protein [Clostridioides difficile]
MKGWNNGFKMHKFTFYYKITSLETFKYYSDYYRKIIAKDLEIDESKVISVSCDEYYENTYED